MRYLLLTAAYIAVAAYCITDILNHRDTEPFGLHRVVWVIIILLFPYIGAAAWLFLRFRGRGGTQRDQRPVAPDDDPEYLMWLREQERRRKRGER